jgi:uncharacterized protein YlaI
MENKCFLCDREFKWKEVVICYLNNNGTRLDFCMDCSERWKDENKRDGVKWGVYQYGVSDFEHLKNTL